MSSSPDAVSPVRLARTLQAFVDTLIPGDGHFPSAATAGTHGPLQDRIRARLGAEAFARIMDTLDAIEPFADASSEARIAAVMRLQADMPDLFHFLRMATYFAYYEAPPVISAIGALGHDYNDSPQPLGYTFPLFDPDKHLPSRPRGSFKATADMARLDLSALTDLGLPVKEV